MILKKSVLKKIHTPRHRMLIALEMGVTENAVRNYILRNDEKLTQYGPLKLIKELLGVEDESELLTDKVTA